MRGEDRRVLLTPDSERSLAFVQQGNVWTLDIPSGQETQLTHLNKGVPRDLSFSPQTQMYLLTLCTGRDLRRDSFLWQFGPRLGRSPTMKQLADVPAMAGAWIQGGKGIASLKPVNDSESLVLETQSQADRTNLLAGTRMTSFCIGAGGQRVYVVSDDEQDLRRIWEYDLERKSLRKIVPNEESTVFRQLVPPVLATATNASQQRIDYYYVPPVGMNPRRKYPVVLDVYFGDRYRTAGQLLAHAGAFYVSTAKFGVPRQWETMPGLEEAMVVQQAMLKHPNVDRRRIFVMSHSSSTVIASELVDANPELWRGVILSSPVAVPRLRLNASGYPSIFISKGDQDGPRAFDYRNSSEPFTREAYRNLLRMKTDIQHAGHDYDRDQQRESFKAMVKFILTD